MRLRNKKTGEIIDDGYVRETYDFQFDGQKHVLAVFKGNGHRPPERVSRAYKSLAELNEEWEDYEEPKTFFTIYYDGTISEFKDGDDDQIRDMKAIGNHFETREEAEKAVEKLKSFTNLKNHEFMFDGWYYGTDGSIVILANAHEFNDMEEQDLTKVFGEKIC